MCFVQNNASKNEHFSNIDFWPLSSLVKSEKNKKTKTDLHNYNASGIQIHLIWFSSFSTFGAFVRKLKPEKNLQRAITRDQKLLSISFCID